MAFPFKRGCQLTFLTPWGPARASHTPLGNRAGAGLEHREATSDSISIITDEFFDLLAVPLPHTPGHQDRAMHTHYVSSAFPPQEYTYPLLGLKDPAEQEQLKVPLITTSGTKPEPFLQGAGEIVFQVLGIFLFHPFLYSVECLQ